MSKMLLVGCLTSQQHASVSQGRICSDNFTCCHTEIEVSDQTFHLTQSHYTDTGPTSPSADPITPGSWQGSHWSANFEVTGMTPEKIPAQAGFEPGIFRSRAGGLTTRPTRRSHVEEDISDSSDEDFDLYSEETDVGSDTEVGADSGEEEEAVPAHEPQQVSDLNTDTEIREEVSDFRAFFFFSYYYYYFFY